MQIELTPGAQQAVEDLLARGEFQTAEEVVEFVLGFYRDCLPTVESLQRALQEGIDDARGGRVAPLDIEDVKRRGRERLIVEC